MNSKRKKIVNIVESMVRRILTENKRYKIGDVVELPDGGGRVKIVNVYKNSDGDVLSYEVRRGSGSVFVVDSDLKMKRGGMSGSLMKNID